MNNPDPARSRDRAIARSCARARRRRATLFARAFARTLARAPSIDPPTRARLCRAARRLRTWRSCRTRSRVYAPHRAVSVVASVIASVEPRASVRARPIARGVMIRDEDDHAGALGTSSDTTRPTSRARGETGPRARKDADERGLTVSSSNVRRAGRRYYRTRCEADTAKVRAGPGGGLYRPAGDGRRLAVVT